MKIKRLEWVQKGNEARSFSAFNTEYIIYESKDSYGGFKLEYCCITHCSYKSIVVWVIIENEFNSFNDNFHTIEKAQAAAQADYEQRILSTFEEE